MLIADVHMLGNVRGHWLDRIKREGQMRASFQAAVRNLSPDIVFILGDVLDEGKYAYPHEFSQVTQRFNRYFTSFMNQQIPRDGHSGKKVEVHIVTGNHDIGFHYDTNYYKVSSERDCFEADWTSDNLNLSKPLREDWDMLSEVVSRNLLSMFKPRLVLSGHAHYRCDIWHSYSKDAKDKTLEVTINSFSWRNNDQPQILLLNVDQTNFVYSKVS
ncbi:metallophosphoesterase 1-like [Convolutriloba macropyga]|uniref:metallophosphoesterase 1-like n=1 Tax=Convolutriloba macropyga TaxID=536237 RepID=UPI003F51E506